MIEAAGAEHLIRKGGWLELYRHQPDMDERLARQPKTASVLALNTRC